jgi:hypothetical protein
MSQMSHVPSSETNLSNVVPFPNTEENRNHIANVPCPQTNSIVRPFPTGATMMSQMSHVPSPQTNLSNVAPFPITEENRNHVANVPCPSEATAKDQHYYTTIALGRQLRSIVVALQPHSGNDEGSLRHARFINESRWRGRSPIRGRCAPLLL